MWRIYVLEPIPGREMCDFCRDAPTSRLYACRNFVPPNTTHKIFEGNVGAWSACDVCELLIDAGDWSALAERAVTEFMRVNRLSRSEEAEVRKQVSEVHQLFRDNVIKELE